MTQSVPSLKNIITRNLKSTTVRLTLVFCCVVLVVQIVDAHVRGRNDAYTAIQQVAQILEENRKELGKITEEYRITCLNNAQVIAYMIEKDPALSESVEELQKAAGMLEIDEIHIFDKTGTIVKGTVPEYYGYNFESGEQISFFKPLLTDKTLSLCQAMTPNTAEGKIMQYSALWSENGEFIVQVGMEPENVIRFMEKNELSYIFSLLNTGLESGLYAINARTGIIEGTTNTADTGKNISEAGLSRVEKEKDKGEFFAVVNGKLSYCVYQNTGENIIADVMPVSYLCEGILLSILLMGACLLLVAALLRKVSMRQMNRLIVQGIADVNESLRKTAEEGEVVPVNVKTCRELDELGSHINEMTGKMMDMRRQIEQQRDKDSLTGLYNRYGLESRIQKLFLESDKMGIAALVLVDADDLKRINDFYGHGIGDVYLQNLAVALSDVDDENVLSARYGGDEFILFFYRQESSQELDNALRVLGEIQDIKTAKLAADISVCLRFSFGVCNYTQGTTFEKMLKEADKNMYENKRQRKQQAES